MDSEFEKRIFERVSRLPEFGAAMRATRDVCVGKIWLIGSAAYRCAAAEFWNDDGILGALKDYDFLTDSLKLPILKPHGVELSVNSFGNPKLIVNSVPVDVVPFSGVHSISRRELAHTIGNYLSGTPLDVQSIAIDVETGELSDGGAMDSIAKRHLSIKDREEAEYTARLANTTVDEFARRIAEGIGFEYRV